jgi:hypothetical protein
MCDHSDDLADMAKSMERIDRKVTELHKLIVGNGEPARGLFYRVAFLEHRIGNAPTWQWMLEKTALPVILAAGGILLGYMLSLK